MSQPFQNRIAWCLLAPLANKPTYPLKADYVSLLQTLEALRILAPNRPNIFAHKFEGNIKFANRNPHIKSRECTIQETFEGLGTKMEEDNPILLIYASLHKNDNVKVSLQATHSKSSMLKSLMKPNEFPNKA